MFSSLQQGSSIYILDKTDNKPKLKVGEIVSVSAPRLAAFNQGPFANQSCVDIKVNVDGNVYDYNSIPSSYNIVTYNNGRITISETKSGLQSEVENLLANSKQILGNIETYKQNVIDCEEILKDLNPQFAKDKERDDRLTSLEDKFQGVEDKIDQILSAITNKK